MKQKNNTKAEIIKEARKIFATKGFDAASMADISEKVGVEKASLYYFFKSKAEIFAAVAEDNWRQLAEEMRTNPALQEKTINKKSFTDFLLKVLKTNLRAGMAVLNFNKCAFEDPRQYSGVMEHMEFLTGRMRDFFKKNNVKNIAAAEQLIRCSIQGYVIQSQLHQRMIPLDKFVKYLIDLIIV